MFQRLTLILHSRKKTNESQQYTESFGIPSVAKLVACFSFPSLSSIFNISEPTSARTYQVQKQVGSILWQQTQYNPIYSRPTTARVNLEIRSNDFGKLLKLKTLSSSNLDNVTTMSDWFYKAMQYSTMQYNKYNEITQNMTE